MPTSALNSHKGRRNVHTLFLAVLLAALLANLWPIHPAGLPPLEPPDQYQAAPRTDNGQFLLRIGGAQKPNPISRLNCGQRLNLTGLDPQYLAFFPGFGRASAIKAVKNGVLTPKQKSALGNLANL